VFVDLSRSELLSYRHSISGTGTVMWGFAFRDRYRNVRFCFQGQVP